MIERADLAEIIDRMPAGVWVALAVANLVLSVVTWSAAGRRIRRAGRLAATAGSQPRTGGPTAKDAALTVAAVIPAVLFWVMVLTGSLHGLVAFGRESLGWRDGWEYLVPGTLDGVSVTFAFLAFRAVRKQKSRPAASALSGAPRSPRPRSTSPTSTPTAVTTSWLAGTWRC